MASSIQNNELNAMLEMMEKKVQLAKLEKEERSLSVQVGELQHLPKGRRVFSRATPASHIFFLEDQTKLLNSKTKELSTKAKQKEELNKSIAALEQKTAKIRASARGLRDDDDDY